MKNDGEGKKDLLSMLGVTVNKEMILALFWCNDVRQCIYMAMTKSAVISACNSMYSLQVVCELLCKTSGLFKEKVEFL